MDCSCQLYNRELYRTLKLEGLRMQASIKLQARLPKPTRSGV